MHTPVVLTFLGGRRIVMSKPAGQLSKTVFRERRERNMENVYGDNAGVL